MVIKITLRYLILDILLTHISRGRRAAETTCVTTKKRK